MAYRVIRDYYRQELFDFYRPYDSPFWAVTFELDATRLLEWLRERGYPIYLNLCYFLTRACQPIEDLRYRLLEGEIVLHDVLHPGLVVPGDGGRFRFAHHDWRPGTEAFNRAAAALGEPPGPALAPWDGEPRAWLYFSALPKLAFTALTHAVAGPDDVEPRVSFGRFLERRGRTLVPVGVQVNHLFVDGAPVGEMAERAQALFDAPD